MRSWGGGEAAEQCAWNVTINVKHFTSHANIGDLKQLSAFQLQNNKLSGSILGTVSSCDLLLI